MNTTRMTAMLTTAVGLLFLVAAASPALAGGNIVAAERSLNGLSAPVALLDDDFDLQACEQECRSIFGIDPYSELQGFGGGRGGSTGYYAYASCIQQCNSKYWKEFDKKMGELGAE